jgi:hypothetical protein
MYVPELDLAFSHISLLNEVDVPPLADVVGITK